MTESTGQRTQEREHSTEHIRQRIHTRNRGKEPKRSGKNRGYKVRRTERTE